MTTWAEPELGTLRREFPGAVVFREEVDSTNSVAATETGAPVLVVAERQTAGRGRQGRSWFGGAGALMFSVRLRAEAYGIGAEQRAAVSLLSALAVVASLAHEGLRVKWPNDVYLGGRKVCGILLEATDVLVVGVGLNYGNTFEEAPPEVRQRAVSLVGAGLVVPPPGIWLVGWWRALEGLMRGWGRGALDLPLAWREHDMFRDGEVDLRVGGERVVGRNLGIDATGRLLVERAGIRKAYASGELTPPM